MFVLLCGLNKKKLNVNKNIEVINKKLFGIIKFYSISQF